MADTTGRIPVRTAPRGVDPASNQPFFYQGTGEFPLPPKYLSNLLRKKGKSTTNY
jgi:hypothetical protein